MIMDTRLGILLALLLAPASCVGPAPVEERPDLGAMLRGEIPAEWSSLGPGGQITGEGDAASVPFWETFEDPVLTGLVEEALVHNRDLLASAERLRGAAARSMVARSARKPQVQARLDSSRQEQVFVGFPFPGGPLES